MIVWQEDAFNNMKQVLCGFGNTEITKLMRWGICVSKGVRVKRNKFVERTRSLSCETTGAKDSLHSFLDDCLTKAEEETACKTRSMSAHLGSRISTTQDATFVERQSTSRARHAKRSQKLLHHGFIECYSPSSMRWHDGVIIDLDPTKSAIGESILQLLSHLDWMTCAKRTGSNWESLILSHVKCGKVCR